MMEIRVVLLHPRGAGDHEKLAAADVNIYAAQRHYLRIACAVRLC